MMNELNERQKQALTLWIQFQELIAMGFVKVRGDNIELTDKGNELYHSELSGLARFSVRSS